MKADYLSYKRAASVSLLGLVLQLGMGLTLLIYGLLAKPNGDQATAAFKEYHDHVAISSGLLVLLGSVVWLVLAVIFDQHRRERIEAMETEALNASGARDASVFTETADDLRVAAKRLAKMHKYLVPTVSLLYAAGLAGIGIWRYMGGQEIVKNDNLLSAQTPGLPIALGLTIAFIGFTFARYVAGMAKQPVWSHLRAGAGAAVAGALTGLLLAVAHFIDYIEPQTPLRFLHVIVPGLTVILAAEVVFNFLGGLYSPRRPGEYPRPALDSKILSFVAAPDRIAKSIGEALNYQFGFDVTGNWFYQLLTRSLAVLLLTGVAVVWLLTCVAVVQPNEQGLRVRMGELKGSQALGPGMYFKLPWPFETVETLSTTEVRRLNLGADQPKVKGSRSILWTNDHGVDEFFFPVRPAADDLLGGPQSRGRDFALTTVEMPVYYVVEDLVKFHKLGPEDKREEILRAYGRRAAFTLLATKTLDDVLGAGRAEIGTQLRTEIEKIYAGMNGGDGAGVKVTYVGVEGVHPPRETAAAFEQIVQAGQKRQGNLRSAEMEANQYLINVAGSVEMGRKIVAAIDELQVLRNTRPAAGETSAEHDRKLDAKQEEIEKLLLSAGGTAATAIRSARAERWTKHMEARAQAEAHSGRIAGYRALPEVYLAQMYFDTLAESMKNSRVYIVADNPHMHVTTNLEDSTNTGSVLGELVKKKKEQDSE